MEGDKLIFLSAHEDISHMIISDFKFIQKKPKMIICIGGASGTGKTEVAMLVRHKLTKLGFKPVIVGLDDYYITKPNDRRSHRQKFNTIGIEEINWEEVHKTVGMFLSSDTYGIFNIRRLNKYTNGEEYITCGNETDVMIVEGLYALNLKADSKVHLKGDYNDTEEFRKKRNKEVIDEYRMKVLKREEEDIIKLSKHAHLTFDYGFKITT